MPCLPAETCREQAVPCTNLDFGAFARTDLTCCRGARRHSSAASSSSAKKNLLRGILFVCMKKQWNSQIVGIAVSECGFGFRDPKSAIGIHVEL